MLIDTHAHLNFKDYKEDAEKVIERALTQKIWLINVGTDYRTSEKAVNQAQFYSEGVYAAVGLHPLSVFDEKYDSAAYDKLAMDSRVVAIGEIGLDYFHSRRQKREESAVKKRQKEALAEMMDLARRLNKPIILHCREAHDDLLKILRMEEYHLPGLMHCFTGALSQAEECVQLGLLLGFNGVITFSRQYDEIIKKIPLEKIVLETDCPFLAPLPFRGQRNESAYVKYVAEKIAELKDLSFKEVADQTTANARELFKI